jgi:hypothetical protein
MKSVETVDFDVDDVAMVQEAEIAATSDSVSR